MWMLGTAALVVPSAGRISMDRARDVSRASAEASLDWAVQRLNDPAQRAEIDGKLRLRLTATSMTRTLTPVNLPQTFPMATAGAQ
jgi:hypothetical protein